MVEIVTNSEKETRDLAKNLVKILTRGAILALSGPLGSGKTAFVKGLAQGLGIKKKITSPTFVIYQVYPVQKKFGKNLYHFDLYRIDNTSDLLELGFDEIVNDKDSIVVIEWAEKIQKHLPRHTTKIKFIQGSNTNSRKIIFR